MIVAFDVDGTIVGFDDKPNEGLIGLLKWFHSNGDRVIVWSGGGKDYAQMWVNRLGLTSYVDEFATKCRESAEELKPDLTFDDCFIDLGKVNCKISSSEDVENW